jgi:hypothetical protein
LRTIRAEIEVVMRKPSVRSQSATNRTGHEPRETHDGNVKTFFVVGGGLDKALDAQSALKAGLVQVGGDDFPPFERRNHVCLVPHGNNRADAVCGDQLTTSDAAPDRGHQSV